MGCKARFREVTKCQHVSKGSIFAGWKAIIKAGLLCEHCEKEKAADVESSCWQMDANCCHHGGISLENQMLTLATSIQGSD